MNPAERGSLFFGKVALWPLTVVAGPHDNQKSWQGERQITRPNRSYRELSYPASLTGGT